MTQEWEMWKFEKLANRGWADNYETLGKITSFNTIISDFPDFLKPTKLHQNTSYMLFKTGIKPMWEDERNINGGRWATYGELGSGSANAEKEWNTIVESLLTGKYDNDIDKICGTQMDIRYKNYRISIWTSDIKDSDGILRTGKISQGLSNDVNDPPIPLHWYYETHETNSLAKSSTRIKHLHILCTLCEDGSNGARCPNK